jgi:hypothetical protein
MNNLLLLVVAIMITVIIASITTQQASAHHQHKCLPPYTTLFVFTEPVQKICTILEHDHRAINASTGEPFTEK